MKPTPKVFTCSLASLAILLSMLGTSSTIVAQQKTEIEKKIQDIEQNTLTGEIFDEEGEPVIGAVVKIEGTPNAVTTNLDGKFAITMPDNRSHVLEVRYVGMKPQRVEIDNKTKYIRLVMKPDVTTMSEVVVTGYQNIKRENATGAYQTIKADDLDKRYTGDLTSNLEGRVPGVVYDPNKSEEDALMIRGQGTFNAKTAPLIVLDGLPIEGGLNSVNTYDIENITILKDASAAAIYGARASNGVIVITTKRAKEQKFTLDFNADVVISEKQNYNNFNWASAADILRLEQYNFDAMLTENPKTIEDNLKSLNGNRISSLSLPMRVLLREYSGEISASEKQSIFDNWARNNYRREWQDAHDRTQVNQQYNLSMRVQGNALSSSVVVNYSRGNRGAQNENDSDLSFKYRGDLRPAKWIDLSFGVNVLNRRTKSQAYSTYGNINSFMNYESMYNTDGSLSRMEADIYPGESVLTESIYALKDPSYNFIEEMGMNYSKYRYTNVRTFLDATIHLPVEGWTVQGQFQYEDIYSRTKTRYNKESQFVRSLYDLYTTAETTMKWVEDPDFDLFEAMMDPNFDWDAYLSDPYFGMIQVANTEVTHNVPYGDILQTTTMQSQFYTFRAQTHYEKCFLERHNIDLLAGLEYRQTHTAYDNNLLYGYDHDTQTNLNLLTGWSFINNPVTGVMGTNYPVSGAPSSFDTSDTTHRYFSYYFTANYVYDSRYSVFGSYRVDKADLFGTDPKFRSRPLWSVGASWNAHNEAFLRDLTWMDVLKLRASYGLTGNIDSSVSSYLTATLSNNRINGANSGTLNTPPNDQLRWEKTSTWNVGLDFGFLNFRINGSLDFYRKNGSDLLTDTDLDPTTGWTSLRINSGKMTNTGVELALNGVILQARSRRDLGISLGVNAAYNKNKVTGVSHKAASGSEYLSMSLHEGFPLNSLFSIDYAGLIDVDGTKFVGWKDSEGNVHTESTGSGVFTIEDCIFSGTYTPTWSGSIMPELRWNGFSLSAMLNFYAGHYMRTDNDVWNNSIGNGSGYKSIFGNAAVSRDLLKYWEDGTDEVPANGYMQIHNGSNISAGRLRNTNVEHADYMKLRNVVVGYSFDKKLCRKIGLNDLRLRFQANNLWTLARNKYGIDPEAYNIYSGYHSYKTPRSYTVSLFFNI